MICQLHHHSHQNLLFDVSGNQVQHNFKSLLMNTILLVLIKHMFQHLLDQWHHLVWRWSVKFWTRASLVLASHGGNNTNIGLSSGLKISNCWVTLMFIKSKFILPITIKQIQIIQTNKIAIRASSMLLTLALIQLVLDNTVNVSVWKVW